MNFLPWIAGGAALGLAARGRRALWDNPAELAAFTAKLRAEKQANRPFRVKFGAPSRGGRFKWLAAGQHSQIAQKDWVGYPIPGKGSLKRHALRPQGWCRCSPATTLDGDG